MSPEMEIPKILWLREHMPAAFQRSGNSANAASTAASVRSLADSAAESLAATPYRCFADRTYTARTAQ